MSERCTLPPASIPDSRDRYSLPSGLIQTGVPSGVRRTFQEDLKPCRCESSATFVRFWASCTVCVCVCVQWELPPRSLKKAHLFHASFADDGIVLRVFPGGGLDLVRWVEREVSKESQSVCWQTRKNCSPCPSPCWKVGPGERGAHERERERERGQQRELECLLADW